MLELNNQIEKHFFECKQNTISDFNKSNSQHGELSAAINQKGLDLGRLLDSEGMQVFEGYKEFTHQLYDLESDMLYLQGYKDCIGLLKYIGVI